MRSTSILRYFSRNLVIAVLLLFRILDDFICKFFTRYVENPRRRVLLKNKMCDRMHQMGFAQSNTTV